MVANGTTHFCVSIEIIYKFDFETRPLGRVSGSIPLPKNPPIYIKLPGF